MFPRTSFSSSDKIKINLTGHHNDPTPSPSYFKQISTIESKCHPKPKQPVYKTTSAQTTGLEIPKNAAYVQNYQLLKPKARTPTNSLSSTQPLAADYSPVSRMSSTITSTMAGPVASLAITPDSLLLSSVGEWILFHEVILVSCCTGSNEIRFTGGSYHPPSE